MIIIEKISGKTQIWIGESNKTEEEYGVYGKFEISNVLKCICVLLCSAVFFILGYIIG